MATTTHRPVRRVRLRGREKVRRLADDINARMAAAPTVTAETDVLYRSLNDQALRTLRAAFSADRDQAAATAPTAARARLQAFCESRIDLITEILESR